MPQSDPLVAQCPCWDVILRTKSYIWQWTGNNFFPSSLLCITRLGKSFFFLFTIPNDDSVTRNYFENLVRALENGLSDVDTHVPCNRSGSSKSLGGGSSRGRRSKGSTSRSSGPNKNVDDSSHWSCDQCTYANANSVTTCAMCQHPR